MFPVGSPWDIREIREDIRVGDLGSDGTQYRPHIVWFEEPVPMIEEAARLMMEADIFILVGTSLQVYPAAGLVHYVPPDAPKYIIDKKIPPIRSFPNLHLIEEPATTGVEKLITLLRS
jgi:NAD-dependent deacetylase